MIRKLLVPAAAALVLAPAALAGNGTGPTLPGLNSALFASGPPQTQGQGQGQGQGQQARGQGQQAQGQGRQGNGANPVRRLRVAVRVLGACALAPTTSARCTALAGKVETAVSTLDGKLQDRIAAIQQTCAAGSTDPTCQNADQRVARLQKLEGWLQQLAAKLQTLFPTSSNG